MKKLIERACIVSLLLIMFFAKDTELIGLDGAVIVFLFLVTGIVYIGCSEEEPK